MDPYKVLGVPQDAPARTIKRAFYRLALQHHPDKLPPSADAASRAAAEEHFQHDAIRYSRPPIGHHPGGSIQNGVNQHQIKAIFN